MSTELRPGQAERAGLGNRQRSASARERSTLASDASLPASGGLRIATVAACPFPAGRGTPIRIHRLADALGRRGHEVDVFTYHLGTDSDQSAFRTYRIRDIPSYRATAPGPTYRKLFLLDPLLAAKLYTGCRRGRYDVIHAHHAEGLLAALPGYPIHRVPLVFDMHTLLETELPSYRMGLPSGLTRSIGRLMDTYLPRYARQTIAVSEEIRTVVAAKAGLSPQRIAVIPNGIEPEFFVDAPRVPLHPEPTLVYAGNLAGYQGIEHLIRAFALARRTRPALRLQVLTDTPFAPYEALARGLGVRDAIEVAEPDVKALPRLLAAADVAVNPRVECAGLPQKLLNYMAAGCAIVSFAGSARHLVHERNGLVVADGDIGALAGAILRLLDDRALALRLGLAARTLARTELTWERAAERVETVYHQALQAPGRRR